MKYPCPCCGHLVFDGVPGSFEICPICFWEDDLSQLRFTTTEGANDVSLVLGQHNYQVVGACELRFRVGVRPPTSDEPVEPGWRPLVPDQDGIEEPIPGIDYGDTYPGDLTRLYYWRFTYWRRADSRPS
jgi:hypothetical protein